MHAVRDILRRQDGPPTNGDPSTTSDIQSSTTTASTPTSTIPTITYSPSPPSPTTTNGSHSHSNPKPVYTIAIIISIVVLLALMFAIYLIRRTRIKHKNPKYIPTTFLKKAWGKWEPESHRYRLPENNDQLEYTGASGARGLSGAPSSFNIDARTTVQNASNTETTGVDRNTSVRSVMTLPAYNMIPGQNEQVLGREGDRGGIDVVLEFPETINEEEAQREAEMEALYQVRLARRRENEEREERRRLRREARERGDHVALRELQNRPANTTTSGPTVEELRREHERIKKERQRAVSSVSYGALGVARHDGTRLRANSNESERQGLLGGAADMADTASGNNYHRRERSESSVLSIDTVNSDFPSPGFTRSIAESRTDSPLRRSFGTEETNNDPEGRAGSSPEIIEHDDFPTSSPPEYDNIALHTPDTDEPHHLTEPPPDYMSPVFGRNEGGSLESALLSERRISGTSRRSMHSDLHPSDSRSSSRRSSRGVGGVPQLPSLRLASLPSIQVDPGSPGSTRTDIVENEHEWEHTHGP